MTRPRTLFDKIWDSHVIGPAGRGHLPALYRPSPDPRGDDAAGLRGAEARRAQGAPARRDVRGRRPQHPDQQPRGRHRRAGIAAAGRDARAQRRRVRRALFPDRQPRPGHRPHHRPGAGPVAARHDDRLRRQPHRDARRAGRARLRHRHLRGRARAGDADADPGACQEHAGRGQRHARRRGQPEGRDPRDHRQDRHRRRHRPCHRICRQTRSARCRWKAA